MNMIAVIHRAFEDSPVTVCFVEAGERTGDSALQYAYRVTQNFEGSWSKPARYEWDGVEYDNPDFCEDVTVMTQLPVHEGKEFGLRSTSMGDHMLMKGKMYEVAAVGFKAVEA